MADQKEILIKVNGLKTYYPVKKGVFRRTVGHVKAVDDVSLDIYRGEILGVVGESGCGKTTLGKSILQLIKPTEGSIRYSFETGEKELMGMDKKELDEARCKMQIVFQDPYSSLNPSFTIFGSMQEPLLRFGEKSKKKRKEKIAELLAAVNLPPEYMDRYPNEFSGGQRQRIGIARALVKEPELVLCDEPIAALDVSIQAQVVNLLKDLQEELKLSYLFTAHDLSMVRYISDRIGVMYLGTIVETGDTDKVFSSALHPYTKALLAAVPRLSKVAKKEDILEGEAESIGTERGCLFASRCPYRSAQCLEARPVLESAAEGHQVACFRWKEING